MQPDYPQLCRAVACSINMHIVAQWLTRDRRATGSSLTGVTALWSLSKSHPSLVLIQPRNTHPYITERLLMGRTESNQTMHQLLRIYILSEIPLIRVKRNRHTYSGIYHNTVLFASVLKHEHRVLLLAKWFHATWLQSYDDETRNFQHKSVLKFQSTGAT